MAVAAFRGLFLLSQRSNFSRGLLRILCPARAFFVPTSRTPSMGTLPHLKRIVGRSRKPSNYFALLVTQFTPRAQTSRATARTLIAIVHLERSPGPGFARKRRESRPSSRKVPLLALPHRYNSDGTQCPERRDAPAKEAASTGPRSDAIDDRLNAAERNPHPAPGSSRRPVNRRPAAA